MENLASPEPLLTRSEGVTASERYLSTLCDKTFLKLWSYPNVFIDRGRQTKGDGKELCDLLVVCGDDIIIFSDKTIAWPTDCPTETAWKRWYKRAIKKSADQVRGAERWLRQFPDRIYLDRQCTKPFPFMFPPAERRRIHGIVVALGAGEACRRYYESPVGSLAVRPRLTSEMTLGKGHSEPFTIGDINPAGSFIHILDDETLDIAISELDTVKDFTEYLTKKEKFFRSGGLLYASGEEDLIAYYVTHMNSAQEHDFVYEGERPFEADLKVSIIDVHLELKAHPKYIMKCEANRISYIWDWMIELFSKHIVDGTSVTPDGPLSLSDGEKCIRHMALQNRFQRRVLSSAIQEAIERGADCERFPRVILPQPNSQDNTAFFFLMLAVPPIQLKGGYDQYRTVRRNIIETYALTILRKYNGLQRVVGIASEPPTSAGSSQDLILVENLAWTDDLISELARRRELYSIMQDDNIIITSAHHDEFPE